LVADSPTPVLFDSPNTEAIAEVMAPGVFNRETVTPFTTAEVSPGKITKVVVTPPSAGGTVIV
jgi:hypothetical protein